MLLQYLRSWCSCVRPVTGSPPSGPCGRYCGCDNTPPPTGSARTSSGPPARSGGRALPGSLRPDSEQHAMRHNRGINRQDLTSVALLSLHFSTNCRVPASSDSMCLESMPVSMCVCIMTVYSVLFHHVWRRKQELDSPLTFFSSTSTPHSPFKAILTIFLLFTSSTGCVMACFFLQRDELWKVWCLSPSAGHLLTPLCPDSLQTL